MAKHKDLSKAHAELFGEGWHIEKKQSPSSQGRKPRKKRCIYLTEQGSCNNPLCGYFKKLCYGSYRCTSYTK